MSGHEPAGSGPPRPSAPDAALQAQRRTQPLLEPAAGPPDPGPPRWVVPTIAGVALLALAISLGFGLAQWRLTSEAQADRDALAAEVALLRAEVEQLRTEVGRGAPAEDGTSSGLDPQELLEDLFGGLFEGGDGAGGFTERLEEWFSGPSDGG